jgi:hypothetical protein
MRRVACEDKRGKMFDRCFVSYHVDTTYGLNRNVSRVITCMQYCFQ